jgi:hypothetical protein
MRRWLLSAALALPLAAAVAQPAAPPHAWVFGSWTGGYFSPVDTEGAACLGSPTVVFTRDVVLRSSLIDVAFRQRLIETVAVAPDRLEFRFVPLPAPPGGPLGLRTPADFGFGCGNPNLLRVERRGPDEIVFPDCADFPAPLARCVAR